MAGKNDICTTLADSCPYWEINSERSKVTTSRFDRMCRHILELARH